MANTILRSTRAIARFLFSRLGVAIVAYSAFAYCLYSVYCGLLK